MKTTTFISIFVLSVLFLNSCTSYDKDDTDPADGRSGLSIATDNKTGCQYLTHPFGGVTPRLDNNGRQICRTNP